MKRIITILLLIIAGALALAACGGNGAAPIQQSDIKYENNLLTNLRKAYPLPILGDSSDLKNQIEFATVQSDPNKIEYLYLIGLNGAPYAHFTIKGQVSAENTQITNPEKMQCSDDSNGNSCVTVPQPDLTGTYLSSVGGGSNFAYTTTGALIQFSGGYVTSDQPFKISTPVSLNLDETAPISATHAHITNGINK